MLFLQIGFVPLYLHKQVFYLLYLMQWLSQKSSSRCCMLLAVSKYRDNYHSSMTKLILGNRLKTFDTSNLVFPCPCESYLEAWRLLWHEGKIPDSASSLRCSPELRRVRQTDPVSCTTARRRKRPRRSRQTKF